MVKLVHCADIHLDGQFTVGDVRDAESRYTELCSSFTSLIMHARQTNARLFLIAGDLFDEKYVSRSTMEMVIREMSGFSSCRFFISPGEGDPYHSKSPYKQLKWPSNVHIFKTNELSCVELPELGVDVYGYAFMEGTQSFNPFAGKHPQRADRLNILLGHGDTTSPSSKYCPITKQDLEFSGFDYIALGHSHDATGVLTVGRSFVSYPGCLEGHGFDEPGYKGAMCGTLDKGRCELTGVRFSKKRYESIELDVSSCASGEQLPELLKSAAKGFKDDTALRIVLTGRLHPDITVFTDELEQKLTGLYFAQIIDNTIPDLDGSALRQDKTLRGVFFRRLEKQLASTDEEERRVAVMALRAGMNALKGRRFE
ncbi:MAG: exonuclease SbcCD subunit D [Eubacteriales bacterium]